MHKPKRLYPKEEPIKPNPKMIFIGSIIFTIAVGWIGIATTNFGAI